MMLACPWISLRDIPGQGIEMQARTASWDSLIPTEHSFPSLFLLSFFLSDFVLFPPSRDVIFCSRFSSFTFGGSVFLLLGAGSLLLRKPNQLAMLEPDFCFTSFVFSCSCDLCKFSSIPSITFSSMVVMVLCLSGSSVTGSPKALENCCSI